jgi:hypothetical protein
MRVPKKTVRIDLGLEAEESKFDRRLYRLAHPKKSDILTMEDRWVEVLKRLWRGISRRLRKEFPDPGRGENLALSIYQFGFITGLSWAEIRGMIVAGLLPVKSTGTGSKRDTDYVVLRHLPQLANYLVRLFDDRQLIGFDWRHLWEETGRDQQPYREIEIEVAIDKLRVSLKGK